MSPTAMPAPSAPAVLSALQAVLTTVVAQRDFALGAPVTSAAPGGGFTAKSTAALFGCDGALSAGMDDAGKLKEVVLEFPGGSIDAAVLARIAGGGFTEILKAVPVAAAVSLRKFTATMNAATSTVDKVAIEFGANKTWTPLGVGFSVSDVVVELTSVQSGADKGVSGKTSGSAAFGSDARLSVAATLFTKIDDVSISATLVAGQATFADAVRGLVGEASDSALKRLPVAIRDAALDKVNLTLKPFAKSVTLTAESSLGRVVLSAAIGDKGPVFRAAASPPAGFKLGDLHGALESLDDASLALDGLALVLASEAGKIDDGFGGLIPKDAQVAAGVTLFAQLDVRKLGLADTLKVDRLAISAAIPFPDPSGMVIAATIGAHVDMGGQATFREVALEIRPNPAQFKVSLVGKVDLEVGRQTLSLRGEMAVEPLTQTAALALSLDPATGAWKDPFGVKGVGIEKLGASLGVTLGPAIPLPTLGLMAGLRLGTGDDPLRGDGALVLNPKDPTHSMVALDVDNVTLPRIIGLVSKEAAANLRKTPLGAALAELQLRNLAYRLVPDEVTLAGSKFEKGCRIACDFTVLGCNARGLFEVDDSKGITALAAITSIKIGSALEFTGARGLADPIVSLTLRTDKQELLINGSVILLKNAFGKGKHFLQSETDLLITPDGLDLSASGQILGLLDVEVECHASGSITRCDGDFSLRAKARTSGLAAISQRAQNAIKDSTAKQAEEIRGARKAVADRKKVLADLDQRITATRARVKARQDADLQKMRDAANASRKASQKGYDELGDKIGDLKDKIARAKKSKDVLDDFKIPGWGIEIGILEARRNTEKLVLDTIGANLVDSLAKTGKNFPAELQSAVGPLEAERVTVAAALAAADEILAGYQAATTGVSFAAQWVVENGLETTFATELIQFETRLSTQADTFAQVQARGVFLGKRFAVQLHLNLGDLEAFARDLVDALINGRGAAKFSDLSIIARMASALAAPTMLPTLTTAEILRSVASPLSGGAGR